MKVIDATNLDYRTLNETLRQLDDCTLDGCCGQRFIAASVTLPDMLCEAVKYMSEYCSDFGYDVDDVLSTSFMVITPDSKNPYKQMYVAN